MVCLYTCIFCERDFVRYCVIVFISISVDVEANKNRRRTAADQCGDTDKLRPWLRAFASHNLQ